LNINIQDLLDNREKFLPVEVLEYVSDRADFVHVTDSTKFFKQILKDAPEYIAVDTEDFFDETAKAEDGVINLFIQNNPINTPFGISVYYNGQGYWVTDNMREIDILYKATNAPLLVGHNYKFDMHMLQNFGVQTDFRLRQGVHPKHVFGDTLTMLHAIDEEHMCKMQDGSMKRSKALKNVAFHYLQGDAHKYEDLVDAIRVAVAGYLGIEKNAVDYRIAGLLAPDVMKDYACADVEFTYKLFPILSDMLEKEETRSAYEIDLGATVAVWDMQRYGVLVNKEKMLDDKGLLESIRDSALSNVREHLKCSLNPASEKELVEAIKNVYDIDWTHFTDKGEIASSKSVLKEFAVEHPQCAPMVDNLLILRKAEKLISTYIMNTLGYVQTDNRVHADFNINSNDYDTGGTVTGRLSSSCPNLQNVPKKIVKLVHPSTGIEYTFNPRAYYVVDEHFDFVFHDYDAQEYSVLGHYSRDTRYMEGLKAGLDIHKFTYSQMYNVPYEDVDEKDQRAEGKQLGFSVVYQVGNASLASALGFQIDTDRLKNGSSFLYGKTPAFKYPPYRGWSMDLESSLRLATLHYENELSGELEENVRIDLRSEYTKVVDGINYYYTDEVQKGLTHAIDIKKRYFANFPQIKDFLDKAKKVGASRMWVKTYWGRKRHIKEKKWSYKLPNAIIQGTCADVMKLKLYEIWKYTVLNKTKSKLVLSVHDEVGLLMHDSEKHLTEIFVTILEDLPFIVPITVGKETGKDWGNKENMS